MKIIFIRKDEEQGIEVLLLCDMDVFFEKVKIENKVGYILELCEILFWLVGLFVCYVYIDKLLCVYFVVEYICK